MPHPLPEGQVARQRELRNALDRKLAALKDLMESCAELLLELEGGALWEGLVVMDTCRQWVSLKQICQLFYEVR